jgi:Na+/H+ antiporter NhaD/arsenite permease-like protein
MKIVALISFVVMYILMIVFQDKRHYFSLGTASLFLILGILPISSIVEAVDFNVILMLVGTMILVYYFIASKMPSLIAEFLLDKSPNVLWVTILMSAFAGIISAFIDNTATVLMIAPVAIEICKKVKTNPVPMILAIAISSNLQGAATLVGDTTSIMLGAHANMDFNAFFFLNGKPSIFFAVELGALASLLVTYFIFRKERKKVRSTSKVKVTNYLPTWLLLGLIVALIIVSFNPDKNPLTNGFICMGFAIFNIFIDFGIEKEKNSILDNLRNIDYQTITLLIGLFLVIGGINHIGIIEDFAKFIIQIGGNNEFLLYTMIVFGSALFSAFIDNIPYVATMLPVVGSIATTLGVNPYLLYFGLLSGATLGGNITPVGASANIAGVGILRKEGYKVGFKEFLKLGVPLTMSALLVGYIFIWFVWH